MDPPTITNQNGLVHENDTDEDIYSFAMSLLSSSVMPIVLQAVLELGILEIIKKLSINGSHFSAKEIVGHLPAKNPEAAHMLDRMLRVLASNSILSCSVKSHPDGVVERLYGLTPVCKLFIKGSNDLSLAPTASLFKTAIDSSYQLKESILEGGHPFERAYGVTQYVYNEQNPDINDKFNTAMASHTRIVMEKILTTYNGFEGLSSLVDVGGGNGTCLQMIVSKYPNIRAVNFDLPHVINKAPPYPAVEHIRGSMFESVPTGDAIFLKWICHCWDDKQCIKILKNCYDALPNNGKVIVCECFLPEEVETTKAAKSLFQQDLIMMVVPSGKERTEKEFQAAGFPGFTVASSAYDTQVMGFSKRIIEYQIFNVLIEIDKIKNQQYVIFYCV